jgi:hypothetical protein
MSRRLEAYKFASPSGMTNDVPLSPRLCLEWCARIGLALLMAIASLVSVDATAQIARPFTIRYSINDNGDIKLIGNTVMTCAANYPTTPLTGDCLSASQGIANPTGLDNNNFNMRNLNVDTSGLTFNSSQEIGRAHV